jgi:hypothetical protein
MNIQPNPMFYTPKSMTEVVAWIEEHPPNDRIHLYTAAMMTWNYLAAQTQKEEEIKHPSIK